MPELGSWLIDDGLVLSPTPGSSNLNMHSAVVQLPADMPVEAKVRGPCITPRVAWVLRVWTSVLHKTGAVQWHRYAGGSKGARGYELHYMRRGI